MFFESVKKSEKELEKLSEYERERLRNIAEIELQVCLSDCSSNMNFILSNYLFANVKIFFPQFADSLDTLEKTANELKASKINAVKRRAKSRKPKFDSETDKESNRVHFVRRSSRIIQEKRYVLFMY